MNFGILQFVVAKNDTDFSQIIFIIVIAVFWVIGAIVKVVSSKAKKSETIAENQKLVKQPGPIQFKIKQKSQVPSQHLKRIKDSVSKLIEQKQASIESKIYKTEPDSVSTDLPEISKLSVSTPVIKTGLEGISKREKKEAYQPIVAESLLSFESIDDLKKGILYYEILGKPLSLRQQERLF